MKVVLVNIDSKLPNLALAKLAMWHRAAGDQVFDLPIYASLADRVYVSCIFDWNRDEAEAYRVGFPDAEIGGTGAVLGKSLPADIDAMRPRINLGFTSRGCIRRCRFCVVPDAEGPFRVTGDLLDLWNGRDRLVMLLDNNILADPDHFAHICSQAIQKNLILDFNQGLDLRLVTDDTLAWLARVTLDELRFSFDDPAMEDLVRSMAPRIRPVFKYPRFYVLTGFDTTFAEDLHRLDVLRELNFRAYVMWYRGKGERSSTRLDRELVRWANMPWAHAKYTFVEFCAWRGVPVPADLS